MERHFEYRQHLCMGNLEPGQLPCYEEISTCLRRQTPEEVQDDSFNGYS
jgi:hypothetical protein